MKKLKNIRRTAGKKESVLLAFKMSIIVGSILNCINQGDCFITGNYDDINIAKLLVTFSVPFFVSLYTSTVVQLRRV